MPTIQQLVRKGRSVLVEKSKSPALDSCLKDAAFVLGCIQQHLKSRIQQCVKWHVFALQIKKR